MNTYSDITSDGGYDPRNVLHKALDPLIGDLKQDEHGEVYVYTGSEWRRVVTPEKQWNDLTEDEIAKAVGSPLDEVYLADFRAVIAAFKEKNQ